MTTPTNSDRLREMAEEVFRRPAPGILVTREAIPHRTIGEIVEAIAPVYEAEINKLEAEKAETIEVLERYFYGDVNMDTYNRAKALLVESPPDQTKEGA